MTCAAGRWLLVFVLSVARVGTASARPRLGIPEVIEIKGSVPYLSVVRTHLERKKREVQIVGGREATRGQVPWQVAVMAAMIDDHAQAQFCGGSLVAPRWVLTAAHCVENTLPEQIQISAGDNDLTAVKKRFDVVRIFSIRAGIRTRSKTTSRCWSSPPTCPRGARNPSRLPRRRRTSAWYRALGWSCRGGGRWRGGGHGRPASASRT